MHRFVGPLSSSRNRVSVAFHAATFSLASRLLWPDIRLGWFQWPHNVHDSSRRLHDTEWRRGLAGPKSMRVWRYLCGRWVGYGSAQVGTYIERCLKWGRAWRDQRGTGMRRRFKWVRGAAASQVGNECGGGHCTNTERLLFLHFNVICWN